jgi:tetratricopeptide (TPR) repeat protein
VPWLNKLCERDKSIKLKVDAFRIWAVLLAVLAGALCFVPLFDVLGYEWSLVLAVAVSLAAAQLAATRTVAARTTRAPSAATAAAARPGATVARLFGANLLHGWLLLVGPLLLIGANSLRVRNCDVPAGLAWFAMLPLLSAAMATALGTTVALLWPWQRPLGPSLLAIGGVLASIGWGVWRFYSAPPIFGYDPFVGFFAGSLYDEELAIAAAFGWARLYQATLAATALATVALFVDGGTLAVRPRWRGRLGVLVVAVGCAAGAYQLHARRAQLGFQLDGADVARALGAEKRTEHFVLHYSPNGPYARQIALDAVDFELRWQELERLFGAAPEAPVHAFLFDSPGQKRGLMGAAHTMVAKPWRREVYLQHEGWPAQTLTHELAHVFAGRFGDPLLAISRRGLDVNVGLIEGVAVAASWAGQPLTPHQVVKVLRDAKLVNGDTLAQVMGPRFFGLNAGQAYNVAGSFCRFLLDTRGAAKLEQLYRDAGSDESYRRIYGASFAELRDQWLAMVDHDVVVPQSEVALALDRLRHPSVFGKPCAHALALARQTAHQAAQSGDRARALQLFNQLCADDPRDVDGLVDALDATVAADARAEARAFAQRLLARDDLNGILRAHAESALGDLDLLDGAAVEARDHYQRALLLPADEAQSRLLTVKHLVASWPAGPSRTAIAQLLAAPAGTHDGAVDLMSLRGLCDADPGRALYRYLLAKQLFARGRFAEIVDLYASSARPTEPLPDARFDREETRVLAVAHYRTGDLGGARALFDRLAHDPDATEGARLDAADWIARCDFARGHQS